MSGRPQSISKSIKVLTHTYKATHGQKRRPLGLVVGGGGSVQCGGALVVAGVAARGRGGVALLCFAFVLSCVSPVPVPL